MLGTDVVTVYVFQEPSLLSSLQDSGLTDVVLHALLVKDVPATREVLGSLPNVFSALCLNARGLASFVASQPFKRLFKVRLRLLESRCTFSTCFYQFADTFGVLTWFLSFHTLFFFLTTEFYRKSSCLMIIYCESHT